MEAHHEPERRNNGNGLRRVTDQAPPIWKLVFSAVGTAVIVSTGIATLLSEYWRLQLAHLDDQSALRHENQSKHIAGLEAVLEAMEQHLEFNREAAMRSAEWMRSNERSINSNVASLQAMTKRMESMEDYLKERTKDRFFRSDWEQARDWIVTEHRRFDGRMDRIEEMIEAKQ